MFGSNALEIGIGVVFTFLTVSLICTAVNEVIAGLRRSRARMLERGIRSILDGTTAFPYSGLKKASRRLARKPREPDPANWGSRFLKHRLIDALSKDEQRPSYVPSRTFVTVLRHLIAEWSQPAQIAAMPNAPMVPLSGVATFADLRKAILKIPNNPQLQAALLGLLEEARGDSNPELPDSVRFDRRLQIWYDYTMDRVSGWYKLQTRVVLLLIGFGIASLANIDTIRIFRVLSSDSTVRATIVAAADQYAKAAKPSGGETANGGSTVPLAGNPPAATPLMELGQGLGQLNRLGIPIGWTAFLAAHPAVMEARQAALNARSEAAELQKNAERAVSDQARSEWVQTAADKARQATLAEASLAAAMDVAAQSPNPDSFYDFVFHCARATPDAFWTKILGWLLTAVSASLGAPFWFDLLNKFISVRAAGKAPEERPKDPKEVLQPQSP